MFLTLSYVFQLHFLSFRVWGLGYEPPGSDSAGFCQQEITGITWILSIQVGLRKTTHAVPKPRRTDPKCSYYIQTPKLKQQPRCFKMLYIVPMGYAKAALWKGLLQAWKSSTKFYIKPHVERVARRRRPRSASSTQPGVAADWPANYPDCPKPPTQELLLKPYGAYQGLSEMILMILGNTLRS